MPTASDIFATSIQTPAETALASAQAIADDLIAAAKYQIDGISLRSRLVGWSAIASGDPAVAAAAQAYYDVIASVVPSVDPAAITPPLYELIPPFAGSASDVARAVADVRACTRAIYHAIGSAMQRWSDLSIPLGWSAIAAAGDASRANSLIAAITSMWPSMSSVEMPVIHAEPVTAE